jgi:Cytochrome c oxidase caa3 assembly factor (Caa3_CtaG)
MRLRALALVGAVAAFEAAILLPADTIEAHILSHALVALIAAPLLVIAVPLRGPEPSPTLRWIVVAVVWTAFVAAHWAALLIAGTQHHLTGLDHLGVHAMLLAAGVLFWLPVLGSGRVVPRLRGLAAGLYLFLAMPAADLTAVWLMARGETGAVGVMLAAMLPLGFAAVAVSWGWILREERVARAGGAAR